MLTHFLQTILSVQFCPSLTAWLRTRSTASHSPPWCLSYSVSSTLTVSSQSTARGISHFMGECCADTFEFTQHKCTQCRLHGWRVDSGQSLSNVPISPPLIRNSFSILSSTQDRDRSSFCGPGGDGIIW